MRLIFHNGFRSTSNQKFCLLLTYRARIELLLLVDVLSMIYDVVFNTNSPNLVFWVSIVVDILLLQTVSIAIASTGILLAAIYYILQIRHQNRMRQTELVMKLYSTFDTLEFLEAWHKIFWMPELKDYDDFVKKLEGKRYIASYVLNFYEEVGILLRRKLIDIGLVDALLGNSTKNIWEKIRIPIEYVRKSGIDPRAYENVEYVYNEMKKRELQLQEGVKNG
jgi:hypothetical protein